MSDIREDIQTANVLMFAHEMPDNQMANAQMPGIRKADETMKNMTCSFRQWAGILDFPGYDNPEFDCRRIISLPDFLDVLAEWFDKNEKTTDPEKKFPRQARIEALKEELRKPGTPKPATYDRKSEGGNEQWKYYVKKNYRYCSDDPTMMGQLESGMYRLGGQVYENLKEDEQARLVETWKKARPNEYPYQAPVTSLENAYIDYISAHTRTGNEPRGAKSGHRGRDDTFEQLKLGISSSFAKGLISKLNEKCPACRPRIKQSKIAAGKAEPQRARAREQKKREAGNGHGTSNGADYEDKRPTKRSRKTKKSPSPADILQAPDLGDLNHIAAYNNQQELAAFAPNPLENNHPEPEAGAYPWSQQQQNVQQQNVQPQNLQYPNGYVPQQDFQHHHANSSNLPQEYFQNQNEHSFGQLPQNLLYQNGYVPQQNFQHQNEYSFGQLPQNLRHQNDNSSNLLHQYIQHQNGQFGAPQQIDCLTQFQYSAL